MDIHHLDCRQLFQNGPRGQSRRQRTRLVLQRHLQAVGDEGDEEVGFDAMVELMVDRPQAQVVFQFLESLLDFSELDVVLPQGGRAGFGQVGTQQVATLPPPGLAQFRLA